MSKYKFVVGGSIRSVTVEADCVEDADCKAREKLNQIAESKGDEAPVRWDLILKKVS